MTSNESDRKSPIEWVIGGLSGVVVLAIMLFLATQAIFSASGAFRNCLRLNFSHEWTPEREKAMQLLGGLLREQLRGT